MSDREEVAAIPLAEERVSIAKKEVESGRVRVRIGVEQREEQVPAELARDAVEIKRVARNQPLTDIPSVRVEGATTIIPVVEEQLVVEKRLVLVEEIHVVRRRETQIEQVPVTLRSETAAIEREETQA
jgi:uncharacterized protein (TIGR02271 family)